MPLEHLADYTDALTEVFARHGTRGTWYAHASVGTLHVRPILDMRARRRGEDARDRRRGVGAGAQVQGRVQRRARRRPLPRRVDRVAVRPGSSTTRSASIKDVARSERPVQPRQDRRSAEDGRRRAVPLPAAGSARAVPDDRARAGARLVGVGRAERSAHRSDHARPERAATRPAASPRRSRCATTTAIAASSTPAPCARAIASTRDEQHLTRGRANTLASRARPASSARMPSPARPCTRRWISASAARAASASARPASTWRG